MRNCIFVRQRSFWQKCIYKICFHYLEVRACHCVHLRLPFLFLFGIFLFIGDRLV
ncbi:hypothetical protein Hanom_Chr12g01089701 [Helianthus anomalus]